MDSFVLKILFVCLKQYSMGRGDKLKRLDDIDSQPASGEHVQSRMISDVHETATSEGIEEYIKVSSKALRAAAKPVDLDGLEGEIGDSTKFECLEDRTKKNEADRIISDIAPLKPELLSPLEEALRAAKVNSNKRKHYAGTYTYERRSEPGQTVDESRTTSTFELPPLETLADPDEIDTRPTEFYVSEDEK